MQDKPDVPAAPKAPSTPKTLDEIREDALENVKDAIHIASPFAIGELIPLKGLWLCVRSIGPKTIMFSVEGLTGKVARRMRGVEKKRRRKHKRGAPK
jgi:hypothetical protein